MFSLGRHAKQTGDERELAHDVPFFDTTHLPFLHHVHDLISLQGSPRRLKRKEAQPRFDQWFDEAMILFDESVEEVDLLQLTGCGHGAFLLQFLKGFLDTLRFYRP